MESIALEIKLECKSCGSSIAINAMHTEFECKACGEFIKVSQGQMRANYAEIFRRVTEENDNRLNYTGSIIPFFLEGMQCTRLYGKKFPVYEGHQLSMETLDKAVTDGFVLINGKKIVVRKPPKGFDEALPQIKYCVGEEEEQVNHLPGNRKNPSGEIQPVLFSCLSCGGALKADGSKRILECSYCKNNSFIPDALWIKFHPVSIVKRWYMIW